MKNINTIITSGLAIAVAVLFYLHFSSNKKSNAPINTKSQNGKPALIAYFEMDSIQSQYQYYKDVESELTKMKLELENNLSKKENENNNVLRAFQNKFKDINQSSSDVDKAAAMKAQQQLQELGGDLQRYKQDLSNKLSTETRIALTKVKDKIEVYLKEYNKNNSYAFILANSNELMYYKDSTYDITNDIIKGLNDSYKKKK